MNIMADERSLYIQGAPLEGPLQIPEAVEEIKAGAFAYCSGITKVIGNSKIYRDAAIDSTAFSGCTSITEIVGFPQFVAKIAKTCGSSQFTAELKSGKAGATTINSITDFTNCIGLTAVTVDSGITSILPGAFSGCRNLREMSLPFIGGRKKPASGQW